MQERPPEFRESQGSGFAGLATFLFGYIIASSFYFSGIAGRSETVWCIQRLLLVLGVFAGMLVYEFCFYKTHRKYFDFAKRTILDKKAIDRILKKSSVLFIMLAFAACPVWFIDVFYAPVFSVFVLSVPLIFLTALCYFVLVELYGRSEGSAVDELLVLFDMVFRASRKTALAKNDQYVAKQTVLSCLVRAYFCTLLLLYYLLNFRDLDKQFWLIQSGDWQNPLNVLPVLFLFCLRLICTFDSCLGIIGYASACKLFGNEFRSVDRSFSGWFFTLICYHPFCQFEHFAKPVFSYAWPESWILLSPLAWIFASALLLLLMLVYAWSNLMFGLAFSNLSNRGIIAGGPYAFVRHPAYSCKLLAWWICTPPLCIDAGPSASILIVLGMLLVTFIFLMRAITEERHLSSDPAYQAYLKAVKWRFLPSVF